MVNGQHKGLKCNWSVMPVEEKSDILRYEKSIREGRRNEKLVFKKKNYCGARLKKEYVNL